MLSPQLQFAPIPRILVQQALQIFETTESPHVNTEFHRARFNFYLVILETLQGFLRPLPFYLMTKDPDPVLSSRFESESEVDFVYSLPHRFVS